jgi:hypothetical protein
VPVEGLRGDIRLVRPSNGSGIGIGTELPEVLPVAKRLKDPPIVEEIRQVDLCDQAVLEPNVDEIIVAWNCL